MADPEADVYPGACTKRLGTVMPVLPFASDDEVVKFAKAFLDEHRERFRKDIAICLKPDDNNSHAYFPALITCIAFLDLLSGLRAGKLDGQKLPELKKYVAQFMDAVGYTGDRLDVLYECFRHKVAHLAQPYVVFDTKSTRGKTFDGKPRRLIAWTVRASGPRPTIDIVPVNCRKQILKAATPWPVFYDHRVTVSIRGFAADIVKSIPKYLRHLRTDAEARQNFMRCMANLLSAIVVEGTARASQTHTEWDEMRDEMRVETLTERPVDARSSALSIKAAISRPPGGGERCRGRSVRRTRLRVRPTRPMSGRMPRLPSRCLRTD
jgi:hypothetical protein